MTAYADIADVKKFARQPDALDDDGWTLLVNGASRLFDNLCEVDADFFAGAKNPQIFKGGDSGNLPISALAFPPTINSVSIEANAYPVPQYRVIGTVPFSDSFDADILDPAKWYTATTPADGDITCVAENGHCRIKAGPYTKNSSGNVKSVRTLDFRGGRMEIDVPSVIGASGGSLIGLYGSFGYAAIFLDGSFAFYANTTGFSAAELNNVEPQATVISKWAIQHHANNNTWEFFLMEDGVWISHFVSPPMNWTPDAMQISIGVYTYGPGTSNTSFDIDSLITDVEPVMPEEPAVLETLDGTVWQKDVAVFIDANWSAAFAYVPADVNFAVIEMALHQWRKSDPAFASISNAENSILLDPVPPTAKATIEKYRAMYTNRVFFA